MKKVFWLEKQGSMINCFYVETIKGAFYRKDVDFSKGLTL